MKRILSMFALLTMIATISNGFFKIFIIQFGWKSEIIESVWLFGLLQMVAGIGITMVVTQLMSKKSVTAPETKKVVFTE